MSQSFDQTRRAAWTGWQELIPDIKAFPKSLTVLDVGCGNGRFGEFLAEHFSEKKITYFGVDQNEYLLNSARVKQWPSNVSPQFTQHDLLELIRHPNLWQTLSTDTNHGSPTLVTLFGVMHHVPSSQLRQQLLTQLSHLLGPGGLLIFSAWQFATDSRYQKRFIAPQKVGLTANQLEANDFFLDWQKGQTAYRYCHFLNQTEAETLIEQSGYQIVRQFSADGKSQQLNKYFVCKVQSNV